MGEEEVGSLLSPPYISNRSMGEDAVAAVMLDSGSGMSKARFVGEDAPCVVFPSIDHVFAQARDGWRLGIWPGG